MDSKIPKPAGFQRKPATTLFDFNSIRKGTDDAAKEPLKGKY